MGVQDLKNISLCVPTQRGASVPEPEEVGCRGEEVGTECCRVPETDATVDQFGEKRTQRWNRI